MLCRDGGERIGVEVLDVVLELDGDCLSRVFGQLGEKLCVGPVGEWIAARADDNAGIEIAVGYVVIDEIVVGHDETKSFKGTMDAVDVEVLGLLNRTFDGKHFEGADFRKDEDEPSVHMGSEAWMLSIVLPVVFGGYLQKLIP